MGPYWENRRFHFRVGPMIHYINYINPRNSEKSAKHIFAISESEWHHGENKQSDSFVGNFFPAHL